MKSTKFGKSQFPTSPSIGAVPTPTTVEVFLQHGFSELELSSVVTTLQVANQVVGSASFEWRFLSDTPGFVDGSCGMIARAEPSVFDHKLADYLIVIGGDECRPEGWLERVRAMQRNARPSVLLSDAATAYIKSTRPSQHPVTTHWRDVNILNEIGFFPTLSSRFSEADKKVITSAGSGFTSELIINLIADHLPGNAVAELASLLLIQSIRDGSCEQPKGISFLSNMFDPQTEIAIRAMEENIEEPLSTKEIAQRADISVRQLERLFNVQLGMPPGRYYKQLRATQAHAMIASTNMKLIDIALATGFASVSTMTKVYRREYGTSPAKLRAGKKTRFSEPAT